MSVINDITEQVYSNVTDFDPVDTVAVVAYLIASVVVTAGLTTLYGYNTTTTYFVSWFTVPIAVMVGATGYTLVTNGLYRDLELDSENGTFVGSFLALHLPALEVLSTQYPNVIVIKQYIAQTNTFWMLIPVTLGAVGIVILSSLKKDRM